MRTTSLAALAVCLVAASAAAQAPCNSCQTSPGWRPVGQPTTVLQPPLTTAPPVVTQPAPYPPDPFVPGIDPGFGGFGSDPLFDAFPPFDGPGVPALGEAVPAAAYANNLGRMDSNNRLNVFDNYSAIPTSRLWVGYQLTDRQQSDVRLVNGATAAQFAALNGGRTLLGQNSAQLLRAGGELAFTPRFSIAVQGQYTWPGDDNAAQEDWTNPQIIVKHVITQGPFTTVSGVFGIAIEAGSDRFVINDASTRVIPGVLFHHAVNQDVFVQGGGSFSFASRNDTNTFDWSLGFGWWAYRAPGAGLPRYQQFDHCVDSDTYGTRGGCGSCRRGCGGCRPWCRGKWIQGIAPGVYFFGKHALNDNDRLNAFGLNYTDPTGLAVARYEEGRHILDITVGGTVLLKHNLSLNLGYSFPITGARARNNEFLMALNWNF